MGAQVRRATGVTVFLVAGVLASWLCALFASQLAQRLSWPLVGRWHGCWDFEHCSVSWWGHAMIGLFVLGPPVAWVMVGHRQAHALTPSRFLAIATMLVVLTALFHVGYYAFVWP